MRDVGRYDRRTYLAGLAGVALSAGIGGNLFFEDSASSSDGLPPLWSSYGSDAGNTGYRPGTSEPDAPVRTRWQFTPDLDAGAGFAAAPVVNPEAVFVAATDGSVWARDLTTGDQRWAATVDVGDADRPVRDSLALDEDHLYVPANDTLYALNHETGAVEWSDTRAGRVGATTVHDGAVLATVQSGPDGPAVVEWDTDGDDGEARHSFDAGGLGSVLAIADEHVVVTTTTDVVCLDREEWTEAWRYAEYPSVEGLSHPVTDGESVYVSVSTGEEESVLHAIDAATGESRWTFDRAPYFGHTPSVADGSVYVQGDNFLWEVDAGSGELASYSDQGGFGKSTLTDDAVYRNEIYESAAIDRSAHEQIWEVDVEMERWRSYQLRMEFSPAPIVLDDLVLLTEFNRGVTALESAPQEASDGS